MESNKYNIDNIKSSKYEISKANNND